MSETDNPLPHGEQSIPFEWGVASYDGQRFVVRDVPEGMAELYVIKGQSDLPRAILRYDAVIYRGKVMTTDYQEQYKSLQFYHDYAGRGDRVRIDEPLADPVFLLKRIHVATHILDFPKEEIE